MDTMQEVTRLRITQLETQERQTNILCDDSELWQDCQQILKSDIYRDKELDFINLGAMLCEEVRTATNYAIGALSSPSTCSFKPIITSEKIVDCFGTKAKWDLTEFNVKAYYFRVRFARHYWDSVRKIAIKSKTDCISYFGLDESIVDIFASSSPRDVGDFYDANPLLHQFKLTCPSQYCLKILKIAKLNRCKTEEQKQLLMLAKMRKINTSVEL